MPNSSIAYGYCNSPLGDILVAGDGHLLHKVVFPTEGDNYRPDPAWAQDDAVVAGVCQQLSAYFSGGLTKFDTRLSFAGTVFQNKVWHTLCEIPFGETITYGILATRIGNPKASRAVGGANGANPIPILVPCHRVIGSDKSLTGFGGGIEIKKYLLDHERQVAAKHA